MGVPQTAPAWLVFAETRLTKRRGYSIFKKIAGQPVLGLIIRLPKWRQKYQRGQGIISPAEQYIMEVFYEIS